MLPFTAENPLHKNYRGPKRPTKQICGINASDMNVTGQKSTRDCRLSANAPMGIRVKAPVAVTGGHVVGAQGDRAVSYGRIPKAKRQRPAKDARIAAKRAYVIAELNKRGYTVNV